MKKILIYIIFLSLPQLLISQENVDSSLVKELNKESLSEKIDLLISQLSDPKLEDNKFFETAYYALKLCNENAYTEQRAKILIWIADKYYFRGVNDSSRLYYNKSIELIPQIKDTLLIHNIYIGTAMYYSKTGDYYKAINYLLTALKIIENSSFYLQKQTCYILISYSYNDQNKPDLAIEYANKAMEIYKENEKKLTPLLSTGILRSLGLAYLQKGEYEKCLDYSFKAIDIFKKYPPEEMWAKSTLGWNYYNVAEAFKSLKEYEKAFMYYQNTLNTFENMNGKYGLSRIYLRLSEISILLKDYQKAIEYSNKAQNFAKEEQIPIDLRDAYYFESVIYDSIRDYKNAYFLYKDYTAVKDSVFNLAKEEKINEIQTKYETEKKEAENKQLKKDNANQKIIISFIFLSLFLMIILTVIFFSGKQKERRNNILLAERNDKIKGQNIILEQQNEEITTQRDQLEELNKLKDKMFSIIGHDLRGPLGTLCNSLDVMTDKQFVFSPAEKDNMIKNLSEGTKSAFALLENLLSWSQSQQKTISFFPEHISLNEIIEITFELLQNTASNKKIELISKLTEDLIVYADKNMLKTIFRNLVSNAIKFSHEKGNVEILASKKDKQVEVKIKDYGTGISKENIEKILDPLEHITTGGTKKEKGSGLGLTLCKELVERNNGTLSVESKLGIGSTFILTLPAQKI